VIRTAGQFVEICEALWGRHWRTEAAKGLGLSRRTISRYAIRQRRIPPDVWEKLTKISNAKLSIMSNIHDTLA
jgi:hypothetical protein